jgi:hypothetical protein
MDLNPEPFSSDDTPISLAIKGFIALGLEELVPLFLILVGLVTVFSICYSVISGVRRIIRRILIWRRRKKSVRNLSKEKLY